MTRYLSKRIHFGCRVLVLLLLLQPRLRGQESRGSMPLGPDSLRAGSMCLIVGAVVESGDFFRWVRVRQTEKGRKFFSRKDSKEVKFFPERLTVKLDGGLDKCVNNGTSEESGANRLDFRLDHDLMTSLQFEVYWKRGFEMRKADFTVMGKEQSRDLVEVLPTAEVWKYNLSVKSENVPLTDALVIVIRTPDGKTVSRLTGHL